MDGPIEGPLDGPLGGPMDGPIVGPLDGPMGPFEAPLACGPTMDIPPIRVRLLWTLLLSISDVVFRFLANASSCRCNSSINAGMGCASGLRRFTNVMAASKDSSIFLCV
jgi:hypothetical protein